MPVVVEFIADVIVYYGGATSAVGYAIANIVVEVAISVIVSKVSQALAGKPGQTGDPPQRLTTARGTVSYQQLVYGQIKTGGFLAYMATSGPNNDILWLVVVYACHEVDAIDDLWLDSRHVANSDIGSGGQVTSAPFVNGLLKQLQVSKYLGGNTSAVDSQLQSALPEWDSSHIGYGAPCVVFQLARDSVVWPSGAPTNFFALIKGRKLYDPRADSTNGGSGAQRFTDPSTWTWSQNWALAVRDYLSGGAVMYASGTADKRKTLGEADARIDDSYIITAANHADESVTVPLPVMAGTTNWTTGSAIVIGAGTLFTTFLANGYWVLAPNGSMLQLAASGAVTDDAHFVLAAVYAGSSVVNEITHWSATNTISTTESRFTADCQLSCGNTHLENLQILLSAGNGKLTYAGGKWRLFAGVYTTPTVTLTQDDIVGAIDVSTHDTTDQAWNYVTGTFYDENNGWAQMPFPAQQDPAYESDDGRQYPQSIDLQATRGVYRAQRLAQVILQQGRNMISVNASALSQKAMQINEWDTFNLTVPEYNWTNQVFRCVSWKFLASGFVSIQARAESSSAYSDLALGAYVDPSTNNPPAFVTQPPDVPSPFTATGVPNGVLLTLTPPGYYPASQFLEIWEFTSNSPFSSATRVGTTRGTTFTVPHSDMITRYYWVTTADTNGGRSTSVPSGAGIAGTPQSSQFWSPQLRGNAASIGGTISKNGGTPAWDSDASSAAPYQAVSVEGTYAGGNAESIGLAAAVGSVPVPSSTVGYYAVYVNQGAGHTYAVAGSTVLNTLAALSPGDRVRVWYDGFYVLFSLNNAVIAATPLQGAQLYVDVSMNDAGAAFTNVQVSTSSIATPSEWVATGNCQVSGTNAVKVGGSPAWDSSIRSLIGHASCHISAKWNSLSDDIIIGLSSTPAASSSYTNADYALQMSAGAHEVYQSGTAIASLGAASLTDQIEISSSGSTISWRINGAVVHTVATSAALLYGFGSFNNAGASVNSLEFGPTETVGVIDTPQIGANAASLLASTVVSGAQSIDCPVSGTPQNLDVGSTTLTCDGSSLGIDVSADMFIGGSHASLTSGLITVRRDGGDVGTVQFDCANALSAASAGFWAGQVTLTVVDTPSAGSHTYTMHLTGVGNGTSGSCLIQATNTAVKIREYKR